jgi:hypothetical protein
LKCTKKAGDKSIKAAKKVKKELEPVAEKLKEKFAKKE